MVCRPACVVRLAQQAHPIMPCLHMPSIANAVARQVYGEYGLVGFWNGTAASLIMVRTHTVPAHVCLKRAAGALVASAAACPLPAVHCPLPLLQVINPTLQYTLYERLSAARARLRCAHGHVWLRRGGN